jgi:cell division septum initiation protein DivIVA
MSRLVNTVETAQRQQVIASAVASLRRFAKQLDDLLHVAPALAALRAGLDGNSDDDPAVRAAVIAPALAELHGHVTRLEAKDDREVRGVIAVARDEARKIKTAAQEAADKLLADAQDAADRLISDANGEAIKIASETEVARQEHARTGSVLAAKRDEAAALTSEHEALVATLDVREASLIKKIEVARQEHDEVTSAIAAKQGELTALTEHHETLAAALDRKEARLVELIAAGKSAAA